MLFGALAPILITLCAKFPTDGTHRPVAEQHGNAHAWTDAGDEHLQQCDETQTKEADDNKEP